MSRNYFCYDCNNLVEMTKKYSLKLILIIYFITLILTILKKKKS